MDAGRGRMDEVEERLYLEGSGLSGVVGVATSL